MLYTKLVQLLPLLTFLAGLENVPTASAALKHRSPLDRHRHLIRRQASAQVGAQKKRDRPLIKRLADGSQCRVRPQSLSASSTVAVTTASASSSATPAVSAQATSPAVVVVASSESSSSATTSTPSSASASPTSAVADWVAPIASSSSSVAAVSTPPVKAVAVSSSADSSGGWANSGSKLGAAWPNGNWASSSDPNYIGNYIGSRTAWYYTWSPDSVGSADSLGLEFVPMLWGPSQVGDWTSQQGSWPSTVKHALFFNEPNESSQCNMAASDSVSYWMNNMAPLRAKGIALGGAATTSAPSGLAWIQDFQALCTQYGNSASDCAMDFVPIHWYDVSPSNFQSYVETFHQQTGLNIWITEYACQNFNGGAQCSDSDTWNLHQSMAAWFDEQDYILRYAPFGMMEDMQGVNQDNALMNPDGSITSLGTWYIGSS